MLSLLPHLCGDGTISTSQSGVRPGLGPGLFLPEAFSGAVSEAPSKLANALHHATVRGVPQ